MCPNKDIFVVCSACMQMWNIKKYAYNTDGISSSYPLIISLVAGIETMQAGDRGAAAHNGNLKSVI